jgi:hypothetical protein
MSSVKRGHSFYPSSVDPSSPPPDTLSPNKKTGIDASPSKSPKSQPPKTPKSVGKNGLMSSPKARLPPEAKCAIGEAIVSAGVAALNIDELAKAVR